MKITTILYCMISFLLISLQSIGQENKDIYVLNEKSLETSIKSNLQAKRATYFNLYHFITISAELLSESEFKKLNDIISSNNNVQIQKLSTKEKHISLLIPMEDTSISNEQVYLKLNITKEIAEHLRISSQNILKND